MRANQYHAKVKAARSCRFCGWVWNVAPLEWITGSPAEIAGSIETAIAGQMDADGWIDGACPDCAPVRRQELAAEARADD